MITKQNKLEKQQFKGERISFSSQFIIVGNSQPWELEAAGYVLSQKRVMKAIPMVNNEYMVSIAAKDP